MAGKSAAHYYMRKCGAAQDKRLNGFDLRVLWTELDCCDWTKPALSHWKSAKTVTKNLHQREQVSESEVRQVKRSRSRLRSWGYITSEVRWRDNGSQKSSITRLTLPNALVSWGSDNQDPPYMKRDAPAGASSNSSSLGVVTEDHGSLAVTPREGCYCEKLALQWRPCSVCEKHDAEQVSPTVAGGSGLNGNTGLRPGASLSPAARAGEEEVG